MYGNIYGQFKQQNVMSSSDLEAVVLLYSEAIESLKMAEEKFVQKKEDFRQDIEFVQKIITGLRSILNFKEGGDIAKNLSELYTYFNSRLTVASYGIKQTPEIISEVVGLLSKLRESWISILPQEKNKTTAQPQPLSGPLDINV